MHHRRKYGANGTNDKECINGFHFFMVWKGKIANQFESAKFTLLLIVLVKVFGGLNMQNM